MEQFWPIFWGAVGTIVTGLVTWLTTYVINLLSSKVKDQKLKTFMLKFTELMSNCVNAVTQTVVQELKQQGKFDDEAKKAVKEKCVELIRGQLSVDMNKFIEENYGDVKEYISTQIEAFIYCNK